MNATDLLTAVAGQNVVLRTGGWNPSAAVVKIEKTTPTQIVVGNSRFRRKDGRPVGDNSYRYRVLAATDANLLEAAELQQEADIRRRINVAATKLDKLRVDGVNLERVEAFLAGLAP